jgi:hypothetical protein
VLGRSGGRLPRATDRPHARLAFVANALRRTLRPEWVGWWVGWVEVAGIEPASFSFSAGLLRAQPVEGFGPVVVTGVGERS